MSVSKIVLFFLYCLVQVKFLVSPPLTAFIIEPVDLRWGCCSQEQEGGEGQCLCPCLLLRLQCRVLLARVVKFKWTSFNIQPRGSPRLIGPTNYPFTSASTHSDAIVKYELVCQLPTRMFKFQFTIFVHNLLLFGVDTLVGQLVGRHRCHLWIARNSPLPSLASSS